MQFELCFYVIGIGIVAAVILIIYLVNFEAGWYVDAQDPGLHGKESEEGEI